MPGAKVVLYGARPLAGEGALTGHEAVDSLQRYRVAACYLGALAINAEMVSEAVRGFDAAKRAMLAASGRSVFLVDFSKSGRRGFAVVAPLSGPASSSPATRRRNT